MVYIFSKKYNPAICNLIDWLSLANVPFIRIADYVTDFYKIDKSAFTHKSSNNFTSESFFVFNKINLVKKFSINPMLSEHLNYEYLHGFFSVLERKKTIGNILHLHSIPKVKVLKDATNLSIEIPDTLFTNDKSDLINFYNINKKVITKSSHDLITLCLNNGTYRSYTKELFLPQIDELPDKFGFSLFQKKVKKKCDIKSFYFNGKFYSQAIFSHNEAESDCDFRIYNDQKPLRYSNFKLPNELEKKVQKLLDTYSLNFAIVDFILDEEERLFFLEINVDGIFETISYEGNYYCEKIIADYINEKLT